MNIVPLPVDVKPVCDLGKFMIERISAAIGIATEPGRIRKLADAQAYAAVVAARAEAQAEVEKLLILADGQIRLTEIQKRAIKRSAMQAEIEQENIENIAAKALGCVNDVPPTNAPSDDWMTFFLNRCKEVSNDDVQNVWARVLAGEFEKPGSFSKQTLGILTNLDVATADLFNRLSHYVWRIENELVPVVFLDYENPLYRQNTITQSAMHELDSVGLVTTNNNGAHHLRNANSTVDVEYFGSRHQVPKPNPWFSISMVQFTRAGLELYRCCDPQRVDGYEEYILGKWKK